jgi:hypothetical protein
MRDFTPCEVEDQFNTYRTTIVEVVFDPLHISEVNNRFEKAGYDIEESMSVITVNQDDSILLWGGLNSVYHLRKGETITGAFDEQHLAFNDLLDLTQRFKIKNKKVEIDDLIRQLKDLYGQSSQNGRHDEEA